MLNLNHSCTVTDRTVSGTDAQTGRATYTNTVVMSVQPCGFSVLSAEQISQSWGDGEATTESNAVRASLILPTSAPAIPDASTATVTVNTYPGTWRIVSSRPGAEWSTLLLAMN